MSVVIRLMRTGAKKRPAYRMVVADSRRQRDGRFLEILGHYNPLAQPFELVVHKDKVEKWLMKGAQPSEQAASLLRSLGISKPAPAALGEEPKPKAQKTEAKAKRRVQRKPSERKTRKKATRAAKKTTAAKA
jgi:small subunit ribosomal protein S16